MIPTRPLRARLLLGACAILTPGIAAAQTTTTTNITTPTTATVVVDQADIVNIAATGSIIVTGVRAINFSAATASATSGPTINNSGTVQSTNVAGYGIDTQNTLTARPITINNLTATSVIQGGEGGIRIRNGAGADLTITSLITVDNYGRIIGTTGGGLNLGSLPNSSFMVTNRSTGVISGNTGFLVSQGTLINSGQITGTAGWAVDTQNTGTGRAITITNASGGTIQGSEGGVRIRNGAGQDTTGVTSANLVSITNGGTIQGGTDQGVNVVGIPNTQFQLTNQVNATIRGSAGVIADHGIIDNYGLITGTATAASGTTFGASNGEGIRLNGTATSGASVITLYSGSTTTGTGSGANAIHVSAGSSTTVNVRAGATLNGDISIDSRVGIVNLDSGSVLNGNVDTDPGQLTVNLQTGATVTGQINGGAAATGIVDMLNLSGMGAATLPLVTAFDRINLLAGDWTLVNTAFATAQGIAIAAGGIARYGNGGTDGAFSGAVENNGRIIVNRSDTVSPGSPISGTGSLEIVSGTLALTVANSYTGTTTITNGRLRGDAANVFAPGSAVAIATGGVLDLNDTAQTVGSVSGSGQIATGTITGGVLTTGGDNSGGTFAGRVTGLGALNKVGAGTLVLSGANTATGTFTVNAGLLEVAGSLAGGATATGGGLGGAGTIAGLVTVNDGATLAPGAAASVGTLTVGALTLTSGAILDYQLGAPGTAGASDRVQVNGNLVLDGTLNITNAGGFGHGVYRLIDYAGTLTDNGLVIGTTPAGTDTSILSVQTAVGNQVNLVYGANIPAAVQFWDGTDLAADGVVDGGSGSWTLTTPNWTDANGANNTAWGGNFAVFQGLAGTVTVDGAIGFGGMQFVTDGYLIAPGTGTLSANEALTNLRVDAGVTATIAVGIGGPGSLTKNDAGTLILSGANSYAGATTINGGTLRVLGGAALPAASAVTVAAGGTLDVAAAQTIGSLAGAGNVVLSGGTLTSGGTNASTTFSGIASGSGGFAKTGTGTLTLSGANTYTGATSVAAGTLLLGTGGQLGTGALDVAAAGTLNLAGIAASVGTLTGAGRVTIGTDGSLTTTTGVDSAFSGQLTGTRASLTKGGAGTLTLSGANTYSGGTIVAGGRLVVANAGALSNTGGVQVAGGATFQIQSDKQVGALSGAGAIELGANRLTTSSAQTVAYTGTATGTGGITKAGTGTLTLGGVNAYTGDTVVAAGTLLLTGSVAGAASVADGATLAGTGSIAGTLTLIDGATLSPGNAGVGTLTVGGLTLSAGSLLAYDLGAPGVAGASDRVQVTGNLVLDGTLNVTDAGGFGQGVYRLIDYGGTLTDNGLAIGALPAGFAAGQGEIQTAVAGQVNLVIGAALPDIQFWDGPNTTANGRVDGGSGSWTNTRRAWTNADGSANGPWGGRFAVFSGTAGTVSVDEQIGFTGLQFTTTGYTLANGTGALVASDAATAIRVDPGVTATIAAGITGAGGIAKLDTGTLILSGANSYAGATSVGGGTLRLAAANTLPTGTAVSVVAGATLDVATAATIGTLAGAGTVTLGATLTTTGAGSTTFTGVLSGTGGLAKGGAGTLTLGGANSYTGTTTVNAGTLQLVTGGRLGSGALTVASGATVDLNGVSTAVGTLSGAGAISLGAGTLSAGAAADSSFTGAISGSGGLIKTGTGNLTLTGTNSFTGTTAVAAGTLTLGSAGAVINAAAVTVASGATLALGVAKTIGTLDGAGAVTLGANALTVSGGSFGGVITDTGAVTKTGAGTLTLGGVNSYTGLTTVSGGTLALAASGSIAASSGVTLATGTTLDVAAGSQTVQTLTGAAGSRIVTGTGTLTAGATASSTFAGIISGAGGFTKAGSGTLTLTAANSYTGATTVNGGILRSGVAQALGQGALVVGASGRADLAGFDQTTASIAGSGAITLGSATLTTGSATSTFDGALSGTGGLAKVGAGTLTLTGANTYTGATTVSAGTLLVNGTVNSAVAVASGARAGGGGTVGGLSVAGTLAPGANGIGTLRVAGTASFAAGSTYEVKTAPDGTADLLAATGAVTIAGGTVRVLAGGTAYGPVTDYQIVTGTAVTGTFSGVTSNLAFLTPTLFYQPSSVSLRLQRNDVDFGAIGTTANQQAVGNALETPQSGTLYAAVLGLDAATARTAFDALSGEVHADLLTLANREVQRGRDPVIERLATTGGDGAGLWLSGRIEHAQADAANGYAGLSADRRGIEGGLDIGFAGGRAGVFVGYTTSDVDVAARGSTGDLATTRVGAYVGLGLVGARLRGGVTYAHHRVGSDRTVFVGTLSDTLAAHESGEALQGFAELGYAIGTPALTIEPFVGVSHARTTLDGATESGGAARLAIGEGRLTTTLGTAGLRLDSSGLLGTGTRLGAAVAARHYFGDVTGSRTASFVGTGASYRVTGVDFGRSGVAARLGVAVPIGGGAEVGAGVSGDYAGEASDYGARVRLGWRF